MDTSIQLASLKLQAEQKALKKVQAKFTTFDQVEQIERHLDKNEKRKHQVDGQLKSAMQSHFICIESCMNNLKEVNNNLNEVKNIIHSIHDEYKTISHLETTLSELRKEANRHKQLKSAKENVKNILSVSDLARQAQEYIDSNRLLEAHQCLLDMETCRNEILEEIGVGSFFFVLE
jgi:archaellum component FlaC